MNLFNRLLCSLYVVSNVAIGNYYGRPIQGFRNDRFDSDPHAYAVSCNVVMKEKEGMLTSMVTRIVIVDENLEIFHDVNVKPIKDLLGSFNRNKTQINDSTDGFDSFYQVRTRIVQLLRYQIIVGHKLNYYLRLFQMRHPVYLRRDTAHFSKFRIGIENKRPSLEQLAKTFLNENIDAYAENITAQAVTSMRLYLKYKEEWDTEMKVRPVQHTMEAFAMTCDTVKARRNDGVLVDVLAKVIIVDSTGATVYQKIFTPNWPIVDYRSNITNLYPQNFTKTVPIDAEREKIELLLKGRILVGHGLSRDLHMLGLKHPYLLRRDSSTFDRFHRGMLSTQGQTLKDIANQFLDKSILHGVRCHLDSAHTAMLLYLQYKREWDTEHKNIGERFKENREVVPKRKVITPVAVYYDRILVTSKLGQLKVIGRLVIVNGNYQCIYDRFVRPNNLSVLDCFTENTGIHVEDIEQGTSIEEIKEDLVNILRDKILIGYNLKHFLLLLGLKFQIFYRRDLRLYNKFVLPYNPKPSIGQIAQTFLNVSLTTYTHPVEKARIFMNLYYKYKEDWDIYVAQTYRDLKMVSLNKVIGNRYDTNVNLAPVAMYCTSVTIKNWGLLGYQMLARITLVDENENCVYDKYVKPYSDIVDYRTNETGIHPIHLMQGEEYFKVLEDILKLISDKIIVGEQLSKCFRLLRHKADWWLLRDISLFSTFRRLNNRYLPLDDICHNYLGSPLSKEADCVEKTKALMKIYKKFKNIWEIEIRRKHEILQNKAKMFQQYRNEDGIVGPYNRSHILH